MTKRSVPDTQSLIDAGRSEAQSEEAATRALDAVLEGRVEPLGIDGPSGEVPARKPWGPIAIVVALLVLALWFFFGRAAAVAVVAPIDAGVQLVVIPPPVEVPFDAGSETVDAGAVFDAGVTAKKPVVVEPLEDALAKELALLDEARLALSSSPAKALVLLDTHHREFPRGALLLEANLLRVETLLALGRRADAEAVAKRLRARDREGLVQERLERLLNR